MEASTSTLPSAPPTTDTDTVEPSTSHDQDPSAPTPLSKNAQKKLLKNARLAELKKERRAAEKEKRKQKKREQYAKEVAEAEAAGEGGPRKKARTDLGPKRPFGARIVVDLAFDELMSENVSDYHVPLLYRKIERADESPCM